MNQASTIITMFFAAATALSASAISSASATASAQGAVPPITPCSQSSAGAMVACSITIPGVLYLGNALGGATDASAGASFGDLSASTHVGANSPTTAAGNLPAIQGTATAKASYDQLLLLPGTGSATIIAKYNVDYSQGGDPYPFSIGSINDAGTTFTIFGKIASELFPFTIQLGVPFDVQAELHFSDSIFGMHQTALSAHLRLLGFTDANGNALTPQLVTAPVATPEPQFAPLLAVILSCGAVFYRRKLRAS